MNSFPFTFSGALISQLSHFVLACSFLIVLVIFTLYLSTCKSCSFLNKGAKTNLYEHSAFWGSHLTSVLSALMEFTIPAVISLADFLSLSLSLSGSLSLSFFYFLCYLFSSLASEILLRN